MSAEMGMSQILSANGITNGGQTAETNPAARPCGVISELKGFTGFDLTQNGPGRVIGAQCIPGALAMSVLPKMPEGIIAKVFKEIAGIVGKNPTVMDQAADVQTAMIDSNISFDGNFAGSIGGVTPASTSGAAIPINSGAELA